MDSGILAATFFYPHWQNLTANTIACQLSQRSVITSIRTMGDAVIGPIAEILGVDPRRTSPHSIASADSSSFLLQPGAGQRSAQRMTCDDGDCLSHAFEWIPVTLPI
jgi:hypothetical protein